MVVLGFYKYNEKHLTPTPLQQWRGAFFVWCVRDKNGMKGEKINNCLRNRVFLGQKKVVFFNFSIFIDRKEDKKQTKKPLVK